MRTRTAVLAVVFSLALAGCVGGGSSRVRVAGSPATVAPDAAREAGYERVGFANRTLNATITITLQGDVEGRESQEVTATIPVARYRHAGDRPAALAVASSPFVQVIENPKKGGDPLSTLSTAELVAFVQSTYRDPASLKKVETRTVSALGTETRRVTYRGTASHDGSTVDVRVHVVRVRDGGDVVTVVSVHPASASERDRVVALLDALRHR